MDDQFARPDAVALADLVPRPMPARLGNRPPPDL